MNPAGRITHLRTVHSDDGTQLKAVEVTVRVECVNGKVPDLDTSRSVELKPKPVTVVKQLHRLPPDPLARPGYWVPTPRNVRMEKARPVVRNPMRLDWDKCLAPRSSLSAAVLGEPRAH